MSDPVQIDPAIVRVGANQIAVAAQDVAESLDRHHRLLGDTTHGWVGSSRSALDELIERWETQHAKWQKAVGETVANMGRAASGFDDTEFRNAHRLSESDENL